VDRLGGRLSATRPLRPPPLAALALACALGLVLAYVVFVRTHAGQRVDEAALSGRLASLHARHAADQLLTTISVGSLALVLVLLVGQALLRRRVAQAVAAVAVVLGSVALAEMRWRRAVAAGALVPMPSPNPECGVRGGMCMRRRAGGCAAGGAVDGAAGVVAGTQPVNG
jgi:hypothetical protein